MTRREMQELIAKFGIEEFTIVVLECAQEGGPITHDRVQKGLVNFDSETTG